MSSASPRPRTTQTHTQPAVSSPKDNRMDKKAVDAAAKEIRANLKKNGGHMQSAMTEMWVDHGYDTPLLEAAFDQVNEKK
jgi:hypothetical protein